MLFAETGAADAVDDHDGTPDAGIGKLVECVDGRLVRFSLVDTFENVIVTGFGADIDLFQTCRTQSPEFFVRFAGDVARRTVGSDPRDFRQVFANGVEDGQQPFGGQCDDVTVSQKYPLDAGIMPAEPFDFLFDVFFGFDRKAFLGLGVHIAIGTFVPAAS